MLYWNSEAKNREKNKRAQGGYKEGKGNGDFGKSQFRGEDKN